MSKKLDKLAAFLREVSNWYWDDFLRAEKDGSYTTNEAIIFALVRACVAKNMTAIKLAIDRLDGKLKTPIRIEYPRVYFLYPNATLPEGTIINNAGLLVAPSSDGESSTGVADEDGVPLEGDIIEPRVEPEEYGEPENLPSLTFRETLAEMSDHPRDVPQQIIDSALQTEQWLRRTSPPPDEMFRVKAVVAAHLLMMSQKGNMDAIGEVFDSIDGKLVETIQILGDDLYVRSYASLAPPGAVPNKDGVLMIEATESQKMWATKLGQDKK